MRYHQAQGRRTRLRDGTPALYETMVALGLFNVPPAWAGPPKMNPGHGTKKSGLILGAGIGELTVSAPNTFKVTQGAWLIEIPSG